MCVCVLIGEEGSFMLKVYNERESEGGEKRERENERERERERERARERAMEREVWRGCDYQHTIYHTQAHAFTTTLYYKRNVTHIRV